MSVFSIHPIIITKGPQPWQVIPCDGDCAELLVEGKRKLEDAPGTILYHVVKEHSGEEVIPWKEAKEKDEFFQIRDQVPCGGPYRLELCSRVLGQELTECIGGDIARNFYAGDLFLIAGQSNSVGFAHNTAEDTPEPGVSVFRMDGTWDMATHPIHDGTRTIFKNLDIGIPGHSPWLACAKKLRKITGRPVGLIPAALGGSALTYWMPGAFLFENAMEMMNRAGTVRAVLWYQGCADAVPGQTAGYRERFLHIVQAFRERTGKANLPFFTCQLNGFLGKNHHAFDEAFSQIRYLQEKAAEKDNVFILPTVGLPLCDQIHNDACANLTIGGQVAAQILYHVYGIQVRAEPLKLRKAIKHNGGIMLLVGPLEGDLTVDEGCLQAFCAEGQGQRIPLTGLRVIQNRIYLEGLGLEKTTWLAYGQGTDVTQARISDNSGGWILMPFVVCLQEM